MSSSDAQATLQGLSSQTQDFFDELHKESDRGAVLIAAAYLDDALRAILCAHFVDDAKMAERLLGKEDGGGSDRAPLGSFSAKITAAYCLGLVSSEDRQDLDYVRQIRNRFAHRRGYSFQNEDIVSWCNAMITWKKMKPDAVGAGFRFLLTVTLLSQRLVIIGLNLKHSTAAEPFKVAARAVFDCSAPASTSKEPPSPPAPAE